MLISISLVAASETTIGIDDYSVEPDNMITAPIRIDNTVNISGCELNITYDPTVVHVTCVTQGDLRYSFTSNVDNGSGWMRANALDVGGLSGNVTFAYINLTAVGDVGDTSPLNITYANPIDINYTTIAYAVNNGSFEIISANDTTPPEITAVAIDPAVTLPNGSIYVTVTATDESGIDTVTANDVVLALVANDMYAGTVTAAGTPGTYNVTVVATDASNNSNVATDDSATYEVKLPATLYIEDVVVRPGESMSVPITVLDVVNLSVCEINFTYNPTVVRITDVIRGDLRYSFKFNVNNGSGWMRANALDVGGLSGNVTFAYLTLTAVGNKSDVSEMEFEDSRLLDVSFKEIVHIRRNGTFSIHENVPPEVTNVSKTPIAILYDNGRPRTPGTNISLLSAHVTDTDGKITTVTINLSSIGGSPAQPMEHVSGDLWEVTTNAIEVAINAPNFTHQLTITATDNDGDINDSVRLELTVLKRGDVNGDGLVDDRDMDYIASYVAGLEPEASNPPGVLAGDVVGEAGCPMGDGVADMMDALYIAKYTNGKAGEP
ncbi:MAG: cohesin domain-containing protein [Euryarchaeota archaeon]|nr:cohesin domain-containing protein [Euryarchaeota archaeon]